MTQMNRISTRSKRLSVLLAGLVFSLLMLHGNAFGQTDGGSDAGTQLSTDNPIVQQIMAVQDTYTDALLSIEVKPASAPGTFLWLTETSSSREWSSGDRELIEEVGTLLARAADKGA